MWALPTPGSDPTSSAVSVGEASRPEPFTPLLRDRLRARYRIAGLDGAQALAASVEPFEKAGLRFAPGAADALVRGLLL